MASTLQAVDAQLAAILGDWSVVTTVLAIVVVGFVLYPIIWPVEPDTHPLLLARQANASAIRHRGESAIFRSPETPHGFPLRTGLNVKDQGAPRWATGKDGDLRDIWREVQRGGSNSADGKPIPKGRILTVHGKEEVVEHDIQDLSKQINILGTQLQAAGVKKVAVYLPNSVEYLVTLFAASFYGIIPVLLPYNQPFAKVSELLETIGADGLVCAAGTLPLEDIAQECKQLRFLTWVVEKSSQHMDWNGVPDSAKSRLTVRVWHDLVREHHTTASADLPTNDNSPAPGDVVVVWQSIGADLKSDAVTFTQQNLVSAVAALISAIPLRQRPSPSDLVLPADSFTHNYVLCQTLAALFSHASVAITSVATPGVDLALAGRGVAPTVIIASAESIVKLHQQASGASGAPLQRLGKYTQAQRLASGRMPAENLLSKFLGPSALGNEPGRLRLILTSERLGAGSPPLTAAVLSDVRIFTRSRIIYALTTARSAGAVTQTNVFDYRESPAVGPSHFGIPLSAVELKVISEEEADVSAHEPHGTLVVRGPSVAGGEVRTESKWRIREDYTLAGA